MVHSADSVSGYFSLRAASRKEGGRKERLVAGEFDLGFGFGGGTVARRGTISPGGDRVQNGAVFGRAGTLKNEGRMNPAVGANDETDAHPGTWLGNVEQWIRRG